jgi:hypothetical protein
MFIYPQMVIGSPLKYKITGIVRDELGKPISGVSVDAFDSDFGTSEDYVGNAVTNPQGKFEINFDDKAFKESFEFLERKPDLFVTVKDSYRLLHKSKVQSEVQGPDVFFEINLSQQRAFDDPYANALQRTISTFNSIGDTVDISQVDIVTSLRQMIRALGNWSYYTTPKIMEFYGYPGPQVPRYPKLVPHQHTLQWNKENSNLKAVITKDGNAVNPESIADGSGGGITSTDR